MNDELLKEMVNNTEGVVIRSRGNGTFMVTTLEGGSNVESYVREWGADALLSGAIARCFIAYRREEP